MKNNKLEQVNHNNHYRSHVTRRDSLKWLSALSISSLLPTISGCDFLNDTQVNVGEVQRGHWPNLKLSTISGKGYGKDPDLIALSHSPWAKTLSTQQLNLVARLADVLVPREGMVPSASEVGVPDVIDEWVSAPYERQQQDRLTVLSLLVWLDDEAQERYSTDFINLSQQNQFSIIDDIAYPSNDSKDEFIQASLAFSIYRKLVLAAFFSSGVGRKDIGYQGGIAILGDYPGPTEEAMAHLDEVLSELGLLES